MRKYIPEDRRYKEKNARTGRTVGERVLAVFVCLSLMAGSSGMTIMEDVREEEREDAVLFESFEPEPYVEEPEAYAEEPEAYAEEPESYAEEPESYAEEPESYVEEPAAEESAAGEASEAEPEPAEEDIPAAADADAAEPEAEPEETETETEAEVETEADEIDPAAPAVQVDPYRLTGDWSEDVIGAAWTVAAYGEKRTDAEFVSAVLDYAGVPAKDLPRWIGNVNVWAGELRRLGMFGEASSYDPARGDIAFFSADEVNDARVGLVSDVYEDWYGDWWLEILEPGEDGLAAAEYPYGDSRIFGYGRLPLEHEAAVFTAWNSDSLSDDGTVITVRGELPLRGYACAYPAGVEEIEGQRLVAACDVVLFDQTGEEVRSSVGETYMTMTNGALCDAFAAGEELSLWHITAGVPEPTAIDEISDGVLGFYAEGLGVYAVTAPVSEEAEAEDAAPAEPVTLVYNGGDYTVTVNYEAGVLPDDVQLQVEEILDSGAYQDYLDQAGEAVRGENKAVADARFFDIRFLAGEDLAETEPAGPVDVRIDYERGRAVEGDVEVKAVHMTDEVEVMDTVVNDAEAEDAALLSAGDKVESVSFTADSFSVYGVIYTVDFWYGKYEYHLNGEGEIMVSELLKELGLLVTEETGNTDGGNTTEKITSMADVVDVTFSDESLVKVEKTGQDWKLTSLKAFDSEEKLTVETKDGVIEIRVTDAKTSDTTAPFKVTIYNGNIEYHTTLKSAVDFANTSDANNAGRTATILMQRDYTLTAEDNNVIIAVARHPVVFDGGGNKLTFSSDQAGGIVLQSGRTPAVGGGNQALNANGSLTFQNITIERNTYTGIVINGSNAAVPVTFNSCSINGSNNTNTTGSLISMNGGALTLIDTEVKNNTPSASGIYAVDSSSATGGKVYISGNTSISDNKSDNQNANLKVNGNSNFSITDNHSGTIGITNYMAAYNTQDSKFGSVAATKTIGTIINDTNGDLIASKAGITDLIWIKEIDSADTGNPTGGTPDTNYGKPVETTDTSLTAPIPLLFSFTSNRSHDKTKQALENTEFKFNIACDKENGASIALATGESDPLTFTIDAASIMDNGTESGDASSTKISYELADSEAPWIATFTKEGTYVFTITESTEGMNGIEFNVREVKYTFYIVEEEGKLRIAEQYKSPDFEASMTESSHSISGISISDLFRLSFVKDTFTPDSIPHDDPIVTQDAQGHLTVNTYYDTIDTATTQFSFDFSRDFEIAGTVTIPDQYGLGIAFHINPNKNAQYEADAVRNTGLDHLDYQSFANGQGEPYFSSGYTVNTDEDMHKGWMLNLMTFGDTRGYASFLIDGSSRIPYTASAGLSSGSYEKLSNLNNVDRAGAYTIKYECNDRANGTGRLTVDFGGRRIIYSNFNAKQIFGADNWNEVFFSFSTNTNQTADRKADFTIQRIAYTESADSANTVFLADRDGDNIFETVVNTTTSPAVAGETIIVRHKITRSDDAQYKYYESVLIRQLKEYDENDIFVRNLSGSNETSYYLNGSNAITGAESVWDRVAGSYNTDVLKNGMKVAVFPKVDGDTYFEYKITAPSDPNHTVSEAAMIGVPPFNTINTKSYGFRTESIQEHDDRIKNTLGIYDVTYNSDGGKFADNTTSKVDSVLKETNYTVISDIPTRDGFVFDGWKLNDTTTYQPGDRFQITSDVTLTAQWVECIDIPVHILEKASDGTNNHDADWRKDDAFIRLLKDESLTEAEARTAAMALIKDDAIYSGTKLVKASISSSYLYGMNGSTEVKLGESQTMTYDGTNVKIGNTILNPKEINLVLIFGHNLTVTKEVGGTMGDPTQDFTVYVSSSALAAGDTYQDAQETPGTYTVDAKNRLTLTLRHGQSITLKELPEGDYTVIEAETGSSYNVAYTGTEDTDTSTDGVQFKLDQDITVTIKNTLGDIAPTGVAPLSRAYLLIFAAGAVIAAGAVLTMNRRRRKEHE